MAINNPSAAGAANNTPGLVNQDLEMGTGQTDAPMVYAQPTPRAAMPPARGPQANPSMIACWAGATTYLASFAGAAASYAASENQTGSIPYFAMLCVLNALAVGGAASMSACDTDCGDFLSVYGTLSLLANIAYIIGENAASGKL